MRKLRKGESYALLRSLADTLKYIKRLPRHCVPRNDEYKKSIMPSNGRLLLRGAHRDDVRSGRSEQVKVDLSKSYRPFKAIYKGNYNRSRTLFSFVLGLICLLFSDAQAQSAGERAAEGSSLEYQGRVLTDAAFTPIEGAKIERLANQSRELVFSDTAGYFVIPLHWGDDSIRVSFHSFGPVTKALYDGRLIRGKSTVFLKKDTSFIDKPLLGDSIPDSIWDLPLQVVNEKSGRRIVTLREYQHKDLIVLDFWAIWCSPCVKALDHWNELQQDYEQQLMVVPVHNSNHTTVADFTKSRGWDMPCVVGENYFILQSHFFKRAVVGNPIFIYKGRYLACPSVHGYDDAAIRGILEGRPVDIVNRFKATHMEGLEGRR